MSAWLILTVIAIVIVLSRVKKVSVEFKDNNPKVIGENAERKRLKD